ncbi:hypothetical protein GQ54DRAFT_221199 [Martensiomyces pterosporus]|nr:hypothetical protein GQ54DRAFT_221199 [Martensiomyces pterosporus]
MPAPPVRSQIKARLDGWTVLWMEPCRHIHTCACRHPPSWPSSLSLCACAFTPRYHPQSCHFHRPPGPLANPRKCLSATRILWVNLSKLAWCAEILAMPAWSAFIHPAAPTTARLNSASANVLASIPGRKYPVRLRFPDSASDCRHSQALAISSKIPGSPVPERAATTSSVAATAAKDTSDSASVRAGSGISNPTSTHAAHYAF